MIEYARKRLLECGVHLIRPSATETYFTSCKTSGKQVVNFKSLQLKPQPKQGKSTLGSRWALVRLLVFKTCVSGLKPLGWVRFPHTPAKNPPGSGPHIQATSICRHCEQQKDEATRKNRASQAVRVALRACNAHARRFHEKISRGRRRRPRSLLPQAYLRVNVAVLPPV